MNSAVFTHAARIAALASSMTALPAAAAAHGEPLEEMDPTKRWQVDTVMLVACGGGPHVADDDLLVALSLAVARWNEVGAGPRLDVAAAEDCGTVVAHDGVNRVGFLGDEPWVWAQNAAAVTNVYRRGATAPISEADISLNPAIAWSLDATEDRGAFDMWNVLSHELGHALGLPDLKDPRPATMFYMTGRGETSKRDLANEDVGMLMKLYEKVDDTSPGCSAAGTPLPLVTLLVLGGALCTRGRRGHRPARDKPQPTASTNSRHRTSRGKAR